MCRLVRVIERDGVTYARPEEAPDLLPGTGVTASMVRDWCRPGGRCNPLRDGRILLVPVDELYAAERATRDVGRRRRGAAPAEIGNTSAS